MLTVFSATEMRRVACLPGTPVMAAVSLATGITGRTEVFFANNGDSSFHQQHISGDVGIKTWEVVVCDGMGQQEAGLAALVKEQGACIKKLDARTKKQDACIKELDAFVKTQLERNKNQSACNKEQGACIKKLDARTKKQGACIKEQDARNKKQLARNKNQSACNKEQGACIKKLDARIKKQGGCIKEQDAFIKEQGACIKKLDTRIHSMENVQLVPWVQNVAAAVLLFLDDQPYTRKSSSRFEKAKGELRNRIDGVAAEFNQSPGCFKNMADKVVSRRNGAVHPSSVDELDALVEQARVAIALCPQKICSVLQDERTILAKYSKVKIFFPKKAGAKSAETDDSKTG